MTSLARGRSWTLLVIALAAAGSPMASAAEGARGRGKFEPPPGKAMVLIGCDAFQEYKDVTGDTPAGGVFWYEFNGDTTFFWKNARERVGPGGVLAIHIGPAERKATEELLSGLRDESIRKLGRAFKEWGRPLYVAIGPEFDHKDNRERYSPKEFVAIFRRVHRIWDELGVTNVAYVWHSCLDTDSRWSDFYPGDKYVDWFGISLYWPNQFQAAPAFASVARAHKKPLIVMESSSINGKAHTFEDWHGPYLRACAALGVRVLCYNNFHDHPQIGEPFKHSAFDQLPRPIAEAWGRAMRTPTYLHASPSLYGTLGVQAQAVARPADGPARDEARPDAISIRRVALSISEKGDCLLSVDTRIDVPPAEPQQGMAASITGLTNARTTSEEGGTHRVVYSFGEVGSNADFAALNGSPMPIDGLSIDRAAGALLLTPILVGKGPVKRSSFSFPRYLKVPITATSDFEDFDNYTVFFSLRFTGGVLQARVSPRHPGWEQDGSRLGATFVPIVNNRTGKESVMLEGKLEPGRLAEYAFHVPADPDSLGRCELNVHLQGHEPVAIGRLDVRGRLAPSFGLNLDNDTGGAKVKAAFKGGACEKAGLKAGDVIVSIDGEKVANAPAVTSRLAQLAIGQEVKFLVKRAGQERTIVVKGE